MTIFFNSKRRDLLSPVRIKTPSHSQNTNTQHFVCSTTPLSLSLFFLSFYFSSVSQQHQKKKQKHNNNNKKDQNHWKAIYSTFKHLGKERERERERERFFLFSSFFFQCSVWLRIFSFVVSSLVVLVTKRVRRPRYLSLFHFFAVSVFFLRKCIFHSSCLRLLFCLLLFCGFARLNFTVWLLIRSFWGLDLT